MAICFGVCFSAGVTYCISRAAASTRLTVSGVKRESSFPFRIMETLAAVTPVFCAMSFSVTFLAMRTSKSGKSDV